jgi:hypothetical protein
MTEVIGERDPRLDPASSHPHRERPWVMIASIIVSRQLAL